MPETDAFIERLLEKGLLKPGQLSRIEQRVAQDHVTWLQALQEAKILFPEQLAQVKAEVEGIPYVDLTSRQTDEAAMESISRQAAATYRFVAFERQDNVLRVAMENPRDFQALEAVKFVAKKQGLRPEIYIASKESIERFLGGVAEIQAEIGGALKEFSQELEKTDIKGKGDADIERVIEEAPVSKVVAVMIRHAIEGHASDIHIEPTENEVRIRYRIDGNLHTSLLLPRKVQAALVSRIKILSNLKIDESRLPQDGRFSIKLDNHPYDFRVATMPTTWGEKVALRILDKSQGAPSFTELGLIGPVAKLYQDHLAAPHGIILISGPTGSGKSTTLFTSLALLNAPDVNIVTLEDPVEYEVSGVNQTQVNQDIGLTFASGLRNLLRQDPDILMVGEIRDKETAALAVHAALTGHLVLSTIHTNDALGTIPRLVDMGIDTFLLTATLRLLVAQRLVSRLCQACKRPVTIPPKLKAVIEETLRGVDSEYLVDPNQREPVTLFESPGCPVCHEIGARGRLAIFEVLPITRELRSAMNESAEYDILQDVARRQGNLTMRQDGILKALRGDVHYEEVMRVTQENSVNF